MEEYLQEFLIERGVREEIIGCRPGAFFAFVSRRGRV